MAVASGSSVETLEAVADSTCPTHSIPTDSNRGCSADTNPSPGHVQQTTKKLALDVSENIYLDSMYKNVREIRVYKPSACYIIIEYFNLILLIKIEWVPRNSYFFTLSVTF